MHWCLRAFECLGVLFFFLRFAAVGHGHGSCALDEYLLWERGRGGVGTWSRRWTDWGGGGGDVLL